METQIKERPQIAMIEVESSQLQAIGHHPETEMLAIQFKGKAGTPGSVYHYRNFTKDDYLAFMTAESKGSHFKKFIKQEVVKHPYERIQ